MTEAAVVCFFLGVLIGLAIGRNREAKRSNRILNRFGYHLVEIQNKIERADARDGTHEAFWSTWEEE